MIYRLYARSIIVGIPNFRRSVDPGFGISTLRSGLASYLCGFFVISSNRFTASIYCAPPFHMILSTPAVFPPLLLITFLTAITLAAKLITSFLCSRYTSLISFLKAAIAIFSCLPSTSFMAFFQSISCHFPVPLTLPSFSKQSSCSLVFHLCVFFSFIVAVYFLIDRES